MTKKDTGKPQKTARKEPSQRNANRTKKKILEAASELFSKDIYENVSTRAIAKQAGVDAALIKRYFGSKEGLFREIVKNLFLEVPLFPSYAVLKRRLPKGMEDFFMQKMDHKVMIDIRILLSSLISPSVAHIAMEQAKEKQVKPFANSFTGKDKDSKAEILLSYIIGIITIFYVVKDTPPTPSETKLIIGQLETLIKGLTEKSE